MELHYNNMGNSGTCGDKGEYLKKQLLKDYESKVLNAEEKIITISGLFLFLSSTPVESFLLYFIFYFLGGGANK